MGALLLLLLAGGTDSDFLADRLRDLTLRYEQVSSRQAPAAVRERVTIVRELGHLPFEDELRVRAGRLLARIVLEDRSYRVRAETARAIARIGTPEALAAMVEALFGPEGREPRFDLLYTVLPEALANLRHPDDLDWIADRILKPGAGAGDKAILHEAGPLEGELLVLTLQGLARTRAAAALAREIVALARAENPQVCAAAVAALVALGVADPAVDEALGDPDERVRAAAAGSRALKPAQAGAAVADPSPLVRASAIRGLSTRPEPGSVTLLLDRLRTEDVGRLRLDLAEALHALTGKDFGGDSDLWSSWWAAARETWDGPEEAEAGERAYFFDLGLRTSRVTFVIDVSASMATADDTGVSRLARAAHELDSAVRALPPATRFRLLMFSGDVRGWPEEGETGDRTRAADAVTALLAQKPGGGTNTYAALMLALEDPFAPDAIVLLSDGSPYRCAYKGKTYAEPEQILHEVERANLRRAVRIHAVALRSGRETDASDGDAAVDFLRRLAAANRGEFREVR